MNSGTHSIEKFTNLLRKLYSLCNKWFKRNYVCYHLYKLNFIFKCTFVNFKIHIVWILKYILNSDTGDSLEHTIRHHWLSMLCRIFENILQTHFNMQHEMINSSEILSYNFSTSKMHFRVIFWRLSIWLWFWKFS